MAGFDFVFSVTGRQMDFGRTLLALVQKWGRSQNVKFRYRKENKGSFICFVDGSLIGIQMLEANIATCLPVFVAVNKSPLTNLECSRVIEKFIRNYNESLCQFHGFVMNCAGLIDGTPNSINFNYGLKENLGNYMQGLSLSFINYFEGNVISRQHVEECHTAIEVLCMKYRKDGSWLEKVDAAISAGALSKNYRDILINLKNLRRGAKHRAQTFSDQDLEAMIPYLIKAIHELVKNVGVKINKIGD